MFPDSKDRFFLPKTMNRASARDRFVAFVIDMVVVSVVASFVISTLGSAGTAVSVIFHYLYFILAHKLFGVTVGKQAMGIFLASNESTGLSWRRAFMREVFWKWVSGILLMYGYIRILFFQEALHDKWSKTAVLSERKVEASFLKAALVTFIFFGLCISTAYYSFTQTPLVGHIVAKHLMQQGHVIRGLSGNPTKGWRVGYWKGQSAQGSFELFDIHFAYDFSELYSSRILNIKEVNVAKAVYRMNGTPDFLNNKLPSRQQETSENQYNDQMVLMSKLVVDKINLTHLKIIRKNEADIDLNRFYISKMSIDKNQASLAQAYIDSPSVHLQVWNSSVNFATKVVDIKSSFELRPSLHPSILKAIDGKIEFRGQLQNPSMVKAEIFKRRLSMYYVSSTFYLKVNNITPSQYIKYDGNIKNFSGEIKNRFCEGVSCLSGGQAKGQFVHNNKKFVFDGTSVWQDDKPESRMRLQMTSLFTDPANTAPLFLVHTEQDIKNYISDIYFAKNYDILSPAEKTNIEKVKKYYFKYSQRSTSSENGGLPSREDFNR